MYIYTFLLGIGPRLTEWKSVVLPLNYKNYNINKKKIKRIRKEFLKYHITKANLMFNH